MEELTLNTQLNYEEMLNNPKQIMLKYVEICWNILSQFYFTILTSSSNNKHFENHFLNRSTLSDLWNSCRSTKLEERRLKLITIYKSTYYITPDMVWQGDMLLYMLDISSLKIKTLLIEKEGLFNRTYYRTYTKITYNIIALCC